MLATTANQRNLAKLVLVNIVLSRTTINKKNPPTNCAINHQHQPPVKDINISNLSRTAKADKTLWVPRLVHGADAVLIITIKVKMLLKLRKRC